MQSTIHINEARKILDRGHPVTMTITRKDGSLLQVTRDNPVVSLSYDVYTGLRTVKFLRSGQKRTVRDYLILAINDFEVFL